MRMTVDQEWYWLREIFKSIENPWQDTLAQIIIPLVVGVGSFAVAWAAFRTSREATRIAKESEAARVRNETRRVEIEDERLAEEARRRYEGRLDDSLVLLFGAIGARFEALQVWQQKEDFERRFLDLNPDTDPRLPEPLPSLHEVSISIDSVRLIARDEDLAIAIQISRAFDRIKKFDHVRTMEPRSVVEAFEELVTEIRQWRNKSVQVEVTRRRVDAIGRDSTA